MSLALCTLLVAGSLIALSPASAEQSMANVRFEAPVPAPTLALAGSSDGRHLAVLDEEARFTFIPDMGEDESSWRAPSTGVLANVGPGMGEVPPIPLGIAVTPSGEYWAGAVRYGDEFGGKLWAFARWSDQPIWSYDLSDGSRDADQPTVLTSGGRYVAMGTDDGIVYVFEAADDGAAKKLPFRTYKADNHGNRFKEIEDVSMSRDGKRILIGTAQSEKGSVHLYSDVFFMFSFSRITDSIQNIEISADGTRGAAVTGSGATTRLHFLDLTQGRTLWETTLGKDAPGLALSKDGKTIAAGLSDGRVLVFQELGRPDDREPTAEHRLVDAIDAVSVSDDGGAIAAGTQGGKLYFLDRDRKAPLWSYDAGSPIVGTLLGNDGEILALSARTDQDARVIFTAADHQIEHMAPPQPRLAPGVINTVPIEVANNGNRMERLSIEWGTLPTGWEGLASNLSLAPGESGSFSAKISVAKGQAPGTYPVPLTITSAHAKIPLAFSVVVPEMTSGRTTERWALPVAVPGGAPAAFVLQLENTGNTRNTATLGYAKLPNGWNAEFVGNTEFTLQPGEDREIFLKVWAPDDATVGREAWFDVVVAWGQGEERVPITIRIVDAPAYRELLKLESDKPEGGVLPAELEADQVTTQAEPGKKESKGTPNVGVALLLAIVGGLVVVARRRSG